MTKVIDLAHKRVSDLTDDYTKELAEWTDGKVPPLTSNPEYAARTSALMIALSRNLARAAAAFGESQNVEAEEVVAMVVKMFVTNHLSAIQTIDATNKVSLN